MAPIEDHAYMKLCAELASSLSISLASARRRVEHLAAKNGIKDLKGRKDIAQELVNDVRSDSGSAAATTNQLDQLLLALEEEDNFMVED